MGHSENLGLIGEEQPYLFGESRTGSPQNGRKHGRDTPSTESQLTPKRLCGERGGTRKRLRLRTLLACKRQERGLAGPVPAPPQILVPMVSVLNDPNFVALGQEVLRMDATQRQMEATLSQKIEFSHREAEKKSEEVATRLGKTIGDSMINLQQKMETMVGAIMPVVTTQEGGSRRWHRANVPEKWVDRN